MTTESNRPAASAPPDSVAHLSAGLRVKGEISGNEDLHVDGTIEGSIQLEGRKLTVGTGAKVTADIVAGEVVVYGSVKGNLRARERIEIKNGGSMIGDLTTARITVEEGAHFKGLIEIDRKGSETASDAGTAVPARPAASVAHMTAAKGS
jgi:cytoskeletal protein CcmA (bactofilin family)